MGNTESQVGNDDTNYWHGSDPNVGGSNMRILTNAQLPLARKSSYLEEPVMTKATERGEVEVTLGASTSKGREGNDDDSSNNKLRYAVSEMQGWRSHMEDEHALNPILASNRQQAMLLKDHHLFAVFDGHGGEFASKFCGDNLVSTLTLQPDWQTYLALPNEGSYTRSSVKGLTLLKSALTSTFLQLDNKLIEAERDIRLGQLSKLESLVYSLGGHVGHDIFQCGTADHARVMNFDRKIPATLPPGISLERSGSTGVVVLVTPSHIICANAGDSRAIMSKKNKVLPLSFDHKPTNDYELIRIEKDGGFVRDGRVDGDLAVARSFGDFGYKPNPANAQKDHRVTVYPDIVVYAREPSNDEFLVLACDGIWDRLSNKECADLVHTLVYREGETDVGLICEEVIDTALELDSRDNMTCCVVMFPPCVKMGRLTKGSSLRGVMKRRFNREQTWGDKSTPAKRAQQRFEERRSKNRAILAKAQMRGQPKSLARTRSGSKSQQATGCTQ